MNSQMLDNLNDKEAAGETTYRAGGETYRAIKNYGGNSVRFANIKDLGMGTRTNKSDKDNYNLDGFSHYLTNLK